jgi:acyl-CoA synthetase (NDP forming)
MDPAAKAEAAHGEDRRDRGLRKDDVQRLFEARTVAVFGASDRTTLHRTALRNAIDSSGGRAVGVNPNRSEVLGMPCVPHAEGLEEVPDLALMLVPDAALDGAVASALQRGIRTLVVPGLDDGPQQRPQVDSLAAAARAAGATLLGPNCMGALVPGGVSPWLASIPAGLEPGSIAFVSQSGAIGEAVVGLGPRLRLRCVVTVGYEACCGVADFCDHLASDPRTSAVGLFVETVRDPDRFLAAARRLAFAGKPLVALKIGASRAAAAIAAGHTGAIVGRYERFRQLCEEAGAILVEDYDELVETLAILDRLGPVAGTRIGAVTNSGGEAALLADIAHRAGIPFRAPSPRLATALRDASPTGLSGCNPQDAWCSEDILATYRRALGALADSGEVDVLVAQLDQTPHVGEVELEQMTLLARALAEVSAASGLPGAVLSMQASDPLPAIESFVREQGLASLRGARAGLRALAAVGSWRALHPGRAGVHARA